MRKLITLFVAFEILAAPVLVLSTSAQAETKKEAALKKCASKRNGCYARCNTRYGGAGTAAAADAVMRCGIRTCDFQYGNCTKAAQTLSAQ